MSLIKSKCWKSHNCVHSLKCAVYYKREEAQVLLRATTLITVENEGAIRSNYLKLIQIVIGYIPQDKLGLNAAMDIIRHFFSFP
jgi:hypothetical protein